MKKADNFDPSKWLVENKITSQSNLNEEQNILDKFFKIFGLSITDDGVITVSKKIGKILCNLAVKENLFEKINDTTYKLK
jgi:hypothetical protein